jgi:hypothetical protein
MVESFVSSTATFRARNPVTLSDDRTLIEANSDSTAIYGIAMNDASESFAGRTGKCLVMVPQPETVFATICETGEVSSILSVGQSYSIEKSGNFLRINPDSQLTPMLTIVGDEYGATINSDDSSIYVRFHADRLGIYSSTGTINIFAQD